MSLESLIKPVPAAIAMESLLGKSKVYIRRAFRAKKTGDVDECQLWSSLALELLGKAALAHIHPSLVAEPTHYESLFAASGIIVGTQIKTIQASTLYKRLQHLSKYFDSNVKDFCDTISLRRNSELHSGEMPFREMRLNSWESNFWHAAEIILNLMDLSLDEWLGADQAAAPKELVLAARQAKIQAAKIRLKQAKESFTSLAKKVRDEAIANSKNKYSFHYPDLFRPSHDFVWETECPACNCRAFLSGFLCYEDVGERFFHLGEAEEVFFKNFVAEVFKCPVCDLCLNSLYEIEAVGIVAEHTEVDTRACDWEPDYGND